MALTLDVTAGEDFAFAVTPPELGSPIRFAFRWMPRFGWWVCIATTLDGTENLGMQQVVKPGGRILLDPRDPRIPPGRFVWLGPDPYVRADLGTTVTLVYLTAAEVAGG